MKSRKRLFLAVVAVAAAFGFGGYLLGQQLESPEDARAEVAAPEASLIAVPVESVALSNDVVVRGDAEFEGAIELELDATLGDGASRVVTGRVPDVDTVVDEGDVLIEVSGRPVFVLSGALPAFREFKPGLEGDDVLQLEESLERLGFLDVPPDKLYGASTEQAIAAMYEAIGYEARGESDGEETALKSARDAVDSARTQLADANDNLAEALKPPSQVSELQNQINRRERLDALQAAKDEIAAVSRETPSSELLEAIAALQNAGAADPELVDQLNNRVVAAQRADIARRENAEEALERAEQALADFDALQAAGDAEGTNTTSAQNAVNNASDRLTDAQADLADLEEDIGIRMPVAEVVFLPDLPRTVTAVDVERGDFVTGSVMRISGTQIRITTGVSEANRPLLSVGQRVIIDSEQLGIEVEGEITELADRTGTNGVADTRYYMLVTPIGEYTVSDMVGVNFRLVIPLEKSEGEVLAVPLAALSAGADGSSRVQVLVGDDETKLVRVTVGLQDKDRSLVEITPIGDNIQAGDLVVVGIDQQAAQAPADAEGDGS